MGNEYDPYREALAVEKVFLWSKGLNHLPPDSRQRVEEELDAHPEMAEELCYVRLATGFRREIKVTTQDVQRILGTQAGIAEIASET